MIIQNNHNLRFKFEQLISKIELKNLSKESLKRVFKPH
jgi:hypothetical protein